MTTKSILLAVSEPQILADLTQALGTGWEAISVSNEEDALGQLEKRSFDALLVDFNLGSSDGSDLLNLAQRKHPDTVRFLIAYEADLALVAAKVEGTPHILPKPVEAASVKSRIEEGIKDLKAEAAASEPSTPPSEAPAVPPIYSLVLKALESPSVSHKQVGKIIARDKALTAEILSLTRSSYLGVQSNFTHPAQAVESLGLETVKAVVVALQFLAENSNLRPAYLSLDQIWQHGINVGQIARDLVLFETKDRALASQALVAGLMHDLGKVVLAKNFDDLYGRVYSLARKQPVAIWDVEKEMFGANHGEIGGCLVGMWNMPAAVVEAVALHHEPPVGEHDGFTPLAAVHIANVLERELWLGEEEVKIGPVINSPFLNHIGLLQRLPIWRAAFQNRKSVDLDPELTAAAEADTTILTGTPESQTTSILPGPVGETQTVTPGHSDSSERRPVVRTGRDRRRWAYAGVVGIVVLLAVWIKTQSGLNEAEPVYARTPAIQAAPATAQSSPVSAQKASEEPVAPPPPAEVVSAPPAAEPVPEPELAIAPTALVTNAAPVSVTPEPKPEPEFRVNGIFYNSVSPSAIVNGKTVGLRDKVSGATVVGIGRSAVLLEINGQTRTCELR